MSVADIKASADALSLNEIGELSRYFRGLALRKNPDWKARVAAAMQNPRWVSQVEMEKTLEELERSGK